MKRLLLTVMTLVLFFGSSALDGQVRSFTKVWDGGLGGVDPDGAGPLPPNLVRAWGMIGNTQFGSIDIDQDGKNEFISYDATNRRIFVYESTGDDEYAVVWHKDKVDESGTTILLGQEKSVMITDLDEDGNLELVMIWDSFHPDLTNGFKALEVYEHDPGSGEFLPENASYSYDPPRDGVDRIALEFMSVATDVDGDGVVELILTYRGRNGLILSIISLPSKDFANPDWIVEYVDSTVAGSDSLQVRWQVHGMTVGDLDGNGEMDMLVQIDGERMPIIVYTATGANTYSKVVFDSTVYHADYHGSAGRLVIADINSNGENEVYLGSRGGNLFVVSGITDIATAFVASKFTLVQNIPAFEGRPTEGVELRGGAWGDADNNGKFSFYVTARDPYEAIYDLEWLGATGGDVTDTDNYQLFNIFHADTTDFVTTGFVSMAIGDYDGDGPGHQDIVFTTGNGNEGVAPGIYLIEYNATIGIPVAAPTNLAASPFDRRVTLTWSANTEIDFLRYRIYGGTATAPTLQVDSTTGGINDTAKTIAGLTNGTTYYYRITAVNSTGDESDYSNEVNATPFNSPPVAVDDVAATPQDSAVTIFVLANDSDVDGDTLTVAGTTQGSYGSVTIAAGDTTVTYTPSQGYNGLDSFTYQVSDGDGGLDTATVYVTIGTEAPHIIGIVDVPADQGRKVFVSWNRSYLDLDFDITQYGIKLHNLAGTWVSLGTVTAERAETYTYLADTFGDSTDAGIFWSKFVVTAFTGDRDYFFASPVDSGYSIDNLAPAAPTGLMASLTEELAVSLAWNGPVDHDFGFFRVYRQAAADTAATTLAETPEPAFTDTTAQGGETYDYWVAALDLNGNESDNSETVSLTVLGTEEAPGLPTAFALHPAYPNPFNPTTTLRFDLPEAAAVTLLVYDLRGRELARLVELRLEAGYHRVSWNGQATDGREVPTGIYVARLVTPEHTKSIKMVLLK